MGLLDVLFLHEMRVYCFSNLRTECVLAMAKETPAESYTERWLKVTVWSVSEYHKQFRTVWKFSCVDLLLSAKRISKAVKVLT